MFTGLVSDVGRIVSVEDRPGLRRFAVESHWAADGLQVGASVMHSGVCLTLTELHARPAGIGWLVEAIPETLARTVLGGWAQGSRVNLERSLRAGDELGGHLVSGHVDGVAEVVSASAEGESWRIRFDLPVSLAPFVAGKGSIAVDGISLTVAAVGQTAGAHWFEVTIIPHTWAATTIGEATPGRRVNLEVDLFARYVARMLEFRAS